jgi:vesicle coat complex subunit
VKENAWCTTPTLFLILFLPRYAAEVDVDFVRKAVRSIGRLAVKIESGAQRCIAALIELIETKVNYVVQEAIVVIKVSYTFQIFGFLRRPPLLIHNEGYLP